MKPKLKTETYLRKEFLHSLCIPLGWHIKCIYFKAAVSKHLAPFFYCQPVKMTCGGGGKCEAVRPEEGGVLLLRIKEKARKGTKVLYMWVRSRKRQLITTKIQQPRQHWLTNATLSCRGSGVETTDAHERAKNFKLDKKQTNIVLVFVLQYQRSIVLL